MDDFSNKCNALISWFEDRRGKTLKLNDKGIDVVISALDKQTPKKIIWKSIQSNSFWRYC